MLLFPVAILLVLQEPWCAGLEPLWPQVARIHFGTPSVLKFFIGALRKGFRRDVAMVENFAVHLVALTKVGICERASIS